MVLPRINLPKLLVKPVGRAISDFGMIKAGDKILLAVSGGKDSLSLFHILRHFQRHSPVKFELGVVTLNSLNNSSLKIPIWIVLSSV